MAKNCKAAIKCSECQSDKHTSALHVGVPPEHGQSMAVKDESQGKETERKHENEAQDYGEEASKNITAKCTEICGGTQKGKSCSMICLANVYKTKAYVVIDDQSNCSLAKSDLFNKLNVTGQTFKYTLQTCAGQNEVEGRRARGIVVESLDGCRSYSIPCLVECDKIPDNKDEIATPQVALSHPHLRPIASKIPEIESDVDILLLVRRDVPQLHKVHESRNGRGNVPWAQRLDLGWVIVGEACLDCVHKPTDITAFKTQLYNGRPSLFEPCPNKLTIQHDGQPQQCDRQETFVRGKFEDGLARDVFTLTAEDNKPGLSVEDKRFVEIMEQNMIKNESGNWTSPLPFRNPVETLPNSRDAALKRLKSTCRTLNRKPLKKQHYLDFMQQVSIQTTT